MSYDKIAGVEFHSAQWERTTTVDRLVADILGISPVDENYWVRCFGTLIDAVEAYDNQTLLVPACPTLGALWVVSCVVDIGAYVSIRSNYRVIASDVRELEKAGHTSYTFILYPYNTEIDLYALCEEPQVDITVHSHRKNISIRPWIPSDDVDTCAFVQCS
jgi:hypothetical protein